jgi:hypothetical protein
MKYQDIAKPFREALGTFEMLRRFGFKSDDIYFHVNPDNVFFVILRTQGREFSMDVGPVRGMSPDQAEEAWKMVATALNQIAIRDQDLARMVEESMAFRETTTLAVVIHNKGIRIPDARARLVAETMAGTGVYPALRAETKH